MFTKANDWQAFIQARNQGTLCEIDRAIFDYFLDVIPPLSMGQVVTLPNGEPQKTSFVFREGDIDPRTAFWQKGGKFYCQLIDPPDPY